MLLLQLRIIKLVNRIPFTLVLEWINEFSSFHMLVDQRLRVKPQHCIRNKLCDRLKVILNSCTVPFRTDCCKQGSGNRFYSLPLSKPWLLKKWLDRIRCKGTRCFHSKIMLIKLKALTFWHNDLIVQRVQYTSMNWGTSPRNLRLGGQCPPRDAFAWLYRFLNN